MTCPLDCEYLRDAHRHEKVPELEESEIPNRDIRVTEQFLEEHDELVMLLAGALLAAAMNTEGTVDYDVREALESLVRTYRTLQSGVYYETVPPNPTAAAVFRAVQDGIGEIRRRETEQAGITKTRDADLLGALAFLQRIEYDRNNGRKRGRAFLDFLYGIYPPAAAPERSPSAIILP